MTEQEAEYVQQLRRFDTVPPGVITHWRKKLGLTHRRVSRLNKRFGFTPYRLKESDIEFLRLVALEATDDVLPKGRAPRLAEQAGISYKRAQELGRRFGFQFGPRPMVTPEEAKLAKLLAEAAEDGAVPYGLASRLAIYCRVPIWRAEVIRRDWLQLRIAR